MTGFFFTSIVRFASIRLWVVLAIMAMLCANAALADSGACCNTIDGSCTIVFAPQNHPPNCAYFLGVGTTCTPNLCPIEQFVCCKPDYTCILATQADCGAASGLFDSGSQSCSPFDPCSNIGACCFDDGSCSILFSDYSCTSSGFAWHAHTSCAPNPCEQPGACCELYGICEILSRRLCEGGYNSVDTPGVFLGSQVTCSPNPCGQGACCGPDGTCTLNTQTGCVLPGSTFMGAGSDCAPSACLNPGACCIADGSCVSVSATQCSTNAASRFLGISTVCGATPCPQYVACCNTISGGCILFPNSECTFENFYWNSHSPTCTPTTCVQGACCSATGACSVSFTSTDCAGTWTGGSTGCSSSACPGACCFHDGACGVLSQFDCHHALFGWVSWLANGTCTPNPCEQPGACCRFVNSATVCEMKLQADCSPFTGTFTSSGTTCGTNPCQLGGCCTSNGSCQFLYAGECFGQFQSGNAACDTLVCPQPGACCDVSRSCVIALESACASPLVFVAQGTVCTPNPCPFPAACCSGPTASCSIKLQATCTGLFYLGEACSPINACLAPCCDAQGACVLVGPNQSCAYSGTRGTTCTPSFVCSHPCCTPDGGCAMSLVAGCAAPAVWVTSATACSPGVCPVFPGACCAADGTCSSLPPSFCSSPATFQGVLTVCTPNPCPQPGACCSSVTSACTLVLQSQCSGSFFPGEACSPVSACSRPCCDASGACTLIAINFNLQCHLPGQRGTACTPNTCTRPCCTPDGACALTLEPACASSAFWASSASACAPGVCPIFAACCAPNGICAISAQSACTSPSTFQSTGTLCTPNPCPQPKTLTLTISGPGGTVTSSPAGINCASGQSTCAASFNSGVSVSLFAVATSGYEFVNWSGPGSAGCTGTSCGVVMTANTQVTATFRSLTGACCLFSFFCTPRLQAQCTSPYTWAGAGTVCSPTPCNSGTCCNLNDGACTTTLQSLCTGASSTFTASQSATCSPNPCPQPGACCLPNPATCQVLPQSQCADSNGIWNGGSVPCFGNICPPSGACCTTSSGACMLTLPAGCAGAGTTFGGPYSVCTAGGCAATLNVVVSGFGSITSSPPGINCIGAMGGVACSASFPAGTIVTLTAAPTSEQVFSGWYTGTAGQYTPGTTYAVTMSGPRGIGAVFGPQLSAPPSGGTTFLAELVEDGPTLYPPYSLDASVPCGKGAWDSCFTYDAIGIAFDVSGQPLPVWEAVSSCGGNGRIHWARRAGALWSKYYHYGITRYGCPGYTNSTTNLAIRPDGVPVLVYSSLAAYLIGGNQNAALQVSYTPLLYSGAEGLPLECMGFITTGWEEVDAAYNATTLSGAPDFRVARASDPSGGSGRISVNGNAATCPDGLPGPWGNRTNQRISMARSALGTVHLFVPTTDPTPSGLPTGLIRWTMGNGPNAGISPAITNPAFSPGSWVIKASADPIGGLHIAGGVPFGPVYYTSSADDGVTWSTPIPLGTFPASTRISVAADSQGRPAVLWWQDNDTLMLSRRQGGPASAWVTQTLFQKTSAMTARAAVAFGPDDRLYVLFGRRDLNHLALLSECAGVVAAAPVPDRAGQWLTGQTRSISVTTSGGTPTSYQWRHDGQPLSNSSRITGATSATLAITNVASGDAGTYDCIVADACASSTSPGTTISVRCAADFNGGSLAVSDIFDFLNAWFAGDPRADFNGGGLAISDVFDFLNAWFAGCP